MLQEGFYKVFIFRFHLIASAFISPFLQLSPHYLRAWSFDLFANLRAALAQSIAFALWPQGIEVLEAGEDHELRAAGHDLQDEGHLTQHLFSVVEDVLLNGGAVLQEGFDEVFIFGFHFIASTLSSPILAAFALSSRLVDLRSHLES